MDLDTSTTNTVVPDLHQSPYYPPSSRRFHLTTFLLIKQQFGLRLQIARSLAPCRLQTTFSTLQTKRQRYIVRTSIVFNVLDINNRNHDHDFDTARSIRYSQPPAALQDEHRFLVQ